MYTYCSRICRLLAFSCIHNHVFLSTADTFLLRLTDVTWCVLLWSAVVMPSYCCRGSFTLTLHIMLILQLISYNVSLLSLRLNITFHSNAHFHIQLQNGRFVLGKRFDVNASISCKLFTCLFYFTFLICFRMVLLLSGDVRSKPRPWVHRQFVL